MAHRGAPRRSGRGMTAPWAVLLTWPARRWLVALAAAAGFVLVVAIPTDLIDTPVFGREVPPTWWAWPSLLVSSLLAGLLVATYVRAPAQPDRPSSRRGGWAGGLLTYFAVGCPVCNKLVLLALGSAGAMTVHEITDLHIRVRQVGDLFLYIADHFIEICIDDAEQHFMLA